MGYYKPGRAPSHFGAFDVSSAATVQNAIDDASYNFSDLPSAIAYIRSNWSNFSNLGTTLYNMQHQASQYATQAANLGHYDIQKQMQDLITQIGQWAVMQQSTVDEYDYLVTGLRNLGLDVTGQPVVDNSQYIDAGTYLGQEPVTIAAALATALIIVGTISYLLYNAGASQQKLNVTQATLAALSKGQISPSDATKIITGANSSSPGILQSLQGITGYLALGALAVFVLPGLVKEFRKGR